VDEDPYAALILPHVVPRDVDELAVAGEAIEADEGDRLVAQPLALVWSARPEVKELGHEEHFGVVGDVRFAEALERAVDGIVNAANIERRVHVDREVFEEMAAPRPQRAHSVLALLATGLLSLDILSEELEVESS